MGGDPGRGSDTSGKDRHHKTRIAILDMIFLGPHITDTTIGKTYFCVYKNLNSKHSWMVLRVDVSSIKLGLDGPHIRLSFSQTLNSKIIHLILIFPQNQQISV